MLAANLKKKQEIQELLGVTPNKSVNYFAEPNKKSDLDESELAFIALKIGPKAIETLAERCTTQFPKAEVDNANHNHRNDGWNFAFDVLRTWNNKTEDSRKVFVLHLYFYIIPLGDPSFGRVSFLRVCGILNDCSQHSCLFSTVINLHVLSICFGSNLFSNFQAANDLNLGV